MREFAMNLADREIGGIRNIRSQEMLGEKENGQNIC